MHKILDSKTPTGKLALCWMGQMGLIIKSENTTIAIDYFASPGYDRQTLPPIPRDEVKDVDAFLGTHDHLDHIDHESWRVWATKLPEAKFVFPRAHMESVLQDGVAKENAIGLNDGENVTIGDMTIHAIPAAHEFLDKDELKGLFPYLQYIIECNGRHIYHAGDTVRYEGMLPRLQAFEKIDVALLPINGRDAIKYRRNCIGNMTYQEAADLAGELLPEIVLPGHYDMFADNSEDPNAFADYVDAKYKDALKVMIPKAGEVFFV